MKSLYRGRRFLGLALLGMLLVVAATLVNNRLGGYAVLTWTVYVVIGLIYWIRRLFSRGAKNAPPIAPVNPAPVTSSWTPPPATETAPVFAPPLQTQLRFPTLGDILMLTPLQFEQTTRDFLTMLGYQNMHTVGGSGDLGADVVGQDRQGRSTIVQCKRYAPGSQVGTPVVQSFIGMMTVHHRAERGIVVTSASFSAPAIDLARQHNITLIDGSSLLLILGLTGMPLAGQTGDPTFAPNQPMPAPARDLPNNVMNDFQR